MVVVVKMLLPLLIVIDVEEKPVAKDTQNLSAHVVVIYFVEQRMGIVAGVAVVGSAATVHVGKLKDCFDGLTLVTVRDGRLKEQ